MSLTTTIATTLSQLFYSVTAFARPDSPFELAEGQKKLGIALMGLGKYSTGQLGPALKETNLIELRGVITGDRAKGEKWARDYKFDPSHVYDYNEIDRLAADKTIDVVYVVLPNSMHAEYTIKCLQAGKHVICEKPMALTPDECRAMITAAEKANRSLAIGYRLHYDPFHIEAMRLGQEHTQGKIKALQAGYAFDMKDTNQWRAKKDMAGGGPIMDLGIYAIQACRYSTGMEPVAVTAIAQKTDRPGMETIEGSMNFTLEFPGGLIAQCKTSYLENYDFLHVETEKGFFHLEPSYTYNNKKGKTHEGDLKRPEVFEQAFQIDAFAYSVLNKKPSNVPGQMGLQDVRIIDALYRAAATGTRVELGA